jgi:hypothetical protein
MGEDIVYADGNIGIQINTLISEQADRVQESTSTTRFGTLTYRGSHAAMREPGLFVKTN